LVKTLVDGPTAAGRHQVAWRGTAGNGRALVNGVYFCRMQARGFDKTIKLLLMK